MNSKEIVTYLVENNDTLVLGTANSDSEPWVSPLGYTYDGQLNFYWVSSKDAVHSSNIRANSNVFITIFGPVPPSNDVDGAYFEAVAKELENLPEINQALQTYGKLEQPDKWRIKSAEDLMGNASWRIYKATVKKSYKRVDMIDKDSGQSVTAREQVALSDPKSLAEG